MQANLGWWPVGYYIHYENMPIQIYWKFCHPKNENFQIKSSDIFHISAQNIDCGYSLEPPRRSGSNEYPQSMFLSRNKKNNVYPCKPQFYYIKVGFNGGQNIIGVFSWCHSLYMYKFIDEQEISWADFANALADQTLFILISPVGIQVSIAILS